MIHYRRARRVAPVLIMLGMALALPTARAAADACSAAITGVSESEGELSFASDCGTIVIEPWGESIVHVQRRPPQAVRPPPSLVVIATQPRVPFRVGPSDATNIVVNL